MRRFNRFVFAISAVLMFSVQAHAFNLTAKSYVVGNPQTGTIALMQDPELRIGPASLTKLMTLYLVFESLKAGELNIEDTVPVSEKAWRMGGSKMFIEVGKRVSVDNLIKGITVASGNDACVAIAEYLGGNEEDFAAKMNAKAKELGMDESHFTNASGWPDPNQYTTARDMFKLASALVKNFPEYYPYFGITKFEFNGISQTNRNGLLTRGLGVDGMKTGNTEESGYHLIASAEKQGARLIAVVMGTNSMKAREEEADKGLNYVFRTYQLREMVKENQVVEQAAPLWLGVKSSVPLLAQRGLTLYISREDSKNLKADLTLTEPLVAPVQAGQVVGQLTVRHPSDGTQYIVPVVAGEDVEVKGWWGRLWDRIGAFFGWLNGPVGLDKKAAA